MYFFVCLFYFSKAYSIHLVFYHLRSWNSPPNETAGGYSWKLLLRGGGGWMCRTVLQILTLFQNKNVIFRTRFYTRSWSQNATLQVFIKDKYVIIAT